MIIARYESKKISIAPIRKIFRVLPVFFLLLTGCVTVTPTLTSESLPDPEKAYIFGNLKLSNPSTYSLVLKIENITNIRNPRRSGMKFNPSGDLQMIAVKPGNYRINGLSFVQSESNMSHAHNSFDSKRWRKLRKVLKIEPGKVYYVGHWDAEASSSFGYNAVTYSWQINSFELNFTQATRDFKQRFPKFSEFEIKEVYQIPFPDGFLRDDPATYSEAAAEAAFDFGDFSLVDKIISQLPKPSPKMKFYQAYMQIEGKSHQGSVAEGYLAMNELVLKDRQPDAMYYRAKDFFNESQRLNRLAGQQSSDQKDQALKFFERGFFLLVNAANLGHEDAINRLCIAGSEPEENLLDQLGMSWCRVQDHLVNDLQFDFEITRKFKTEKVVEKMSDEFRAGVDKYYEANINALIKNEVIPANH